MEVRVGGEDDLLDLVIGEPVEQFPYAQLIRSDSGNGIDGAAEDVVAAPEASRAFDRHDILRLFDHTDD